jgi:hypothetical protein
LAPSFDQTSPADILEAALADSALSDPSMPLADVPPAGSLSQAGDGKRGVTSWTFQSRCPGCASPIEASSQLASFHEEFEVLDIPLHRTLEHQLQERRHESKRTMKLEGPR